MALVALVGIADVAAKEYCLATTAIGSSAEMRARCR